MQKAKKASNLRIGGIVILVLAALAAILPVVFQSRQWLSGSGGQQIQPMELGGSWLGMRLTGAESATARAMGVPPTMKGVLVAEFTQLAGSRAALAGIRPGDIIVKLDGQDVTSLTDFYTMTTKLDVARPVPVDVIRQGVPLSTMLPQIGVPQAQPGAPGMAGMPGVPGAMVQLPAAAGVAAPMSPINPAMLPPQPAVGTYGVVAAPRPMIR